MSAAVTAPVRAALAWAQAGDDALTFVAELLEPREVLKLDLYLDGIADLAGRVPALVSSSAEAAQINDALAHVARAAKAIEELRVERLRPVLAEQRSIQAIFAPVLRALGALQERCKGGIASWMAAERERVRLEREAAERAAVEAAQRQAAAEERAETAADPGERAAAGEQAHAAAAAVDAALNAAPREAPRAVRSEHGTTSTREEWTVEVVDESQVPRQYLDVNATRLRAAVRSGVREIPGCVITQQTRVTVRPR